VSNLSKLGSRQSPERFSRERTTLYSLGKLRARPLFKSWGRHILPQELLLQFHLHLLAAAGKPRLKDRLLSSCSQFSSSGYWGQQLTTAAQSRSN
jgi:hypothetical protein